MANIVKIIRKKGVVYRAEVVQPDYTRISKTFRTKSEAETWARGAEDQARNERACGIVKVRLTCDQYFDRFIKEYATFHHSEGWIISEKQMYRDYIHPVIGNRLIDLVQPNDISRILREMQIKGRSASTTNMVLRTLKKMFNEAVNTDRFITRSPAALIKPFKAPPKETRVLTKDEAQLVLRWCDQNRFGIGIALALNLGLRQSEVIGLKWDAIDFDNGTLTVKRAFQKKVKKLQEFAKGKKTRIIGLGTIEFVRRLQNVRQQNPNSEFVVCNESGQMVSPMQLNQTLWNATAATKVKDVTFHELRHTFASLYRQAGGDLYDLQKILGHESVSTTERYRHTNTDYLKEKGRILDLYPKNLTLVSSA